MNASRNLLIIGLGASLSGLSFGFVAISYAFHALSVPFLAAGVGTGLAGIGLVSWGGVQAKKYGHWSKYRTSPQHRGFRATASLVAACAFLSLWFVNHNPIHAVPCILFLVAASLNYLSHRTAHAKANTST